MPLNLIADLAPIAGYTLVRRLGGGGFGEAWEAEAPGGVHVALKFIRLGTVAAGYEERALEVIRNIRHPHLVDVQFAARVDDCLIIAMPLCDQSLMDRLAECREQGQPGVPRDEMLRYMAELAGAIDFLNEPRHDTGDGTRLAVQHRDIKPQNIFLVGGSARLADFGLAKALEGSFAVHTGAMSVNYVAPEAIEGRISSRSDQYSLAATYAQLRTGILPFSGDSIHQILYGHVHDPPNLGDLPEDERAVVARALAKRPEERWPSCRALVVGLEAAALAQDARLGSTFGLTQQPGLAWDSGAGPTTDRDAMHTDTFASPALPTTRNDDGLSPGVARSNSATRGPRRRVALAGLVLGCAVVVAGTFLLRPGTASRSDPPAPQDRPATSAVPKDPRPVLASGSRPDREIATDNGDAKLVATRTPAGRPLRVATTPDPDLTRDAHAILKKHCYGCHGSRFEVPGYNVLDRDILVAAPPAGKKRKAPYIAPGRPDDSLLWTRLGVEQDMPPEGPLPSAEERSTLKRWIEAGAHFPVDPPRPFLAEKDILRAVHDHLEKTPVDARPYQRYFTLANLHNNRKVLDDDLRLYRAALAKLANSLSWKPRIAVPRAVDPHEAVLAIDLRDLGWDQNDLWLTMIRREEPPPGTQFLGARDVERKGYPYGLTHDRLPADEETRRLAGEVSRLTGCELPCIRADWFIATASRPPIYEALLGLPASARDLERRLGVDVRANFLHDRLARAGFASSGVSSHNRMVERHEQEVSPGAYWKSYDFKSDEGTAELPRFPLGPVFADNPFPRQAFAHAGGEIIFHLPNKLQAYLLVNNNDERIEEGPIAIVGDSLRTGGTAAIVNGLSCMACHKNGMIGDLKDTIRTGHALAGEAKAKVERLFPTKAVMDRLLAQDEEAFLTALEMAMGAFLKVGAEAGKPIRDFAEPIGAVARLYVKDLGLEEVAFELGLEPDSLRARLEANPALRRLGLGTVLQPGGTIKRAAWESLRHFNSPFQEAALQLDLGTPYHEL